MVLRDSFSVDFILVWWTIVHGGHAIPNAVVATTTTAKIRGMGASRGYRPRLCFYVMVMPLDLVGFTAVLVFQMNFR